MRPERAMAELFPTDLPLMEPVCYIDASYAGLLPIEEHRSISGIFICLGGTCMYDKTHIQRTTVLPFTEAAVVAGCDAGNIFFF
jgi:hypothetical protein